MTHAITRPVLPSELRIRPVNSLDQDLFKRFLGEARRDEIRRAGLLGFDAELDRPRVELDRLLEAVRMGVLRGWVTSLPDGTDMTLYLFGPADMPGMFGGECINSADAEHGRGVGTAGLALALDELFADPEVWRIHVYVVQSNRASRRMLDKLGFVEEGVARKVARLRKEERDDAWIMSMLRDEWKGSSAFEQELTG